MICEGSRNDAEHLKRLNLGTIVASQQTCAASPPRTSALCPQARPGCRCRRSPQRTVVSKATWPFFSGFHHRHGRRLHDLARATNIAGEYETVFFCSLNLSKIDLPSVRIAPERWEPHPTFGDASFSHLKFLSHNPPGGSLGWLHYQVAS